MTKLLRSNPWNLGSSPDVAAALLTAMRHSRTLTLGLFETIGDDRFMAQAHGDFSPVGWHLGHIGYTESRWILEGLAGQPSLDPQTRKLFAADGLPKAERQNLPDRAHMLAQLADIRSRVETVIAQTDLSQHPRLGPFLLQHESQHCETVAIVLALLGQYPTPKNSGSIADPAPMIHIPAGGFWQGADDAMALDNEQPRHWVELANYAIAATPVTCGQYQQFIQAGGYHEPQWWSAAGWAWLKASPQSIDQPYYWQPELAQSSHPVCGVSWYEADAYARFSGQRLPTEAEWEKAARWNGAASQTLPWGDTWPDSPPSANLSGLSPTILRGTTPVQTFPTGRSPAGLWDCLGNVWEWTDSWFDGYPGFTAFPYKGYSEVYFDRAHRVLRGGSWATRPWSIRSSFRNWYHPWTRVIFAGFRTCRDA
jgi:gamma-glutamyl hercynylcysteine S-oxide synthase